jgi:hypothetical protein
MRRQQAGQIPAASWREPRGGQGVHREMESEGLGDSPAAQRAGVFGWWWPDWTATCEAGESTQVAGVFDRYDRWITRRLRAFVAKRWRNGLWRCYPDQYFWFHLGLTRLYHLRRDFIRELEARRHAGNRPVERSAGNPHATFVRGTEAPC